MMHYRTLKRVILHCTATPDDYARDYTVHDIDAWHKKRGWDGIGYHYFIKRDGTIQRGRMLHEVGAHCAGHNKNSIGICYTGTKKPTKKQIESIRLLFKFHEKVDNIGILKWHCHNEFSNKACPGFSVETLRDMLR